MYRLLIVEDDFIIARTLCGHLEKWGYQTEYVQDFQNVLEHFVRFDPQLVLLDISLPFYNGYHWCEQIRTLSKVPVLFISSISDNLNIVMAMTMGGDDFISKPFDLTVITAKIQALLRRSYDFTGQSNLLVHNGVVLNAGDASLTYQQQKINLTKNEFKILQLLMQNSGKTVYRDEIMTALWETNSFIDDNTLTVNITRLRKKLASAGLCHFITTKKGLGYLIQS